MEQNIDGMSLEICVDTFASAQAAFQGGADRIELCSALPLGGLTPTTGLLMQVKRSHPGGLAMCMLRPRGGDFVYDADEMATVCEDLAALKAAGADGFVFGALDRDGKIDEKACANVIGLAKPLPVTLHRAIDHSMDWEMALETAIRLGFSRVLSSGQATTAVQGIAVLRLMVAKATGRIGIIVGSGVTPETLPQLLMNTDARVDFHGSASIAVPSAFAHRPPFAMGSADTDVRRQTSAAVVRQMKALLTS